MTNNIDNLKIYVVYYVEEVAGYEECEIDRIFIDSSSAEEYVLMATEEYKNAIYAIATWELKSPSNMFNYIDSKIFNQSFNQKEN